MTTHGSRKISNALKILIPVAMIILLVVGGLSLIQFQFTRSPDRESSTEIARDKIVKDFYLTSLDGKKKLISELPHKIVLINFWATWCEACVDEMPSLVNLRNRYKNQGFEILGINLDENPEAVLSKAVRQLGIEFPVFKDPDGDLSDLFNIHAIPFTVIMDHQRKILFVKHGEMNWDSPKMQAEMERWLAK